MGEGGTPGVEVRQKLKTSKSEVLGHPGGRLGAGVVVLLAGDRAERGRAILWYEVSTDRASIKTGSGKGGEGGAVTIGQLDSCGNGL